MSKRRKLRWTSPPPEKPSWWLGPAFVLVLFAGGGLFTSHNITVSFAGVGVLAGLLIAVVFAASRPIGRELVRPPRRQVQQAAAFMSVLVVTVMACASISAHKPAAVSVSLVVLAVALLVMGLSLDEEPGRSE